MPPSPSQIMTPPTLSFLSLLNPLYLDTDDNKDLPPSLAFHLPLSQALYLHPMDLACDVDLDPLDLQFAIMVVVLF